MLCITKNLSSFLNMADHFIFVTFVKINYLLKMTTSKAFTQLFKNKLKFINHVYIVVEILIL